MCRQLSQLHGSGYLVQRIDGWVTGGRGTLVMANRLGAVSSVGTSQSFLRGC